jgi:polygalacturonase
VGSHLFSRRSFLASVSALWAARVAGAGRSAHGGLAVLMIMPPQWLKEAYEVIRKIQAPVFPNRGRRLSPQGGDERERVQEEIDKLSAQGGGRVSLAPGDWFIAGPLRLKSKIDLHLEEGAQVSFSGSRADYLPLVHTRWEGTELYGYSPCIYAYEVNDVAITGKGSLRMASGDIDNWRGEQDPAQLKLRQMGDSGVPLSQRIFGSGSFLRQSFIQFFNARNILVEGVRIGPMPFWGVHIVFSHHATVRGIHVESNQINNDGIDVDSSTHVLIESCTFRTADDCIAIKSGRDLDGRQRSAPSQDIVVRDCVMSYSRAAAVAIGSEMSGGVRNVYVFRCEVGKAELVFNVKSNLDRGGFVERLRVWNVQARQCTRLVQVTTSYHGYRGGKFPPRFEDIEVEDVRADKVKEGIAIRGVRESPIKNVTLRNITIKEASQKISVNHAVGLLCERVEIQDERIPRDCRARKSTISWLVDTQ